VRGRCFNGGREEGAPPWPWLERGSERGEWRSERAGEEVQATKGVGLTCGLKWGHVALNFYAFDTLLSCQTRKLRV